jgi:hypothetical protein
MRKKRFTEEQIVAILKESAAGMRTGEANAEPAGSSVCTVGSTGTGETSG